MHSHEIFLTQRLPLQIPYKIFCQSYFFFLSPDCCLTLINLLRRMNNAQQWICLPLRKYLEVPYKTLLVRHIFSYAIYLCFGIPPYFIGACHRLIFRLAQNNLLSRDDASSGLLKFDFRFEM